MGCAPLAGSQRARSHSRWRLAPFSFSRFSGLGGAQRCLAGGVSERAGRLEARHPLWRAVAAVGGDPLPRDSSFCSLSWPYTGPHFCTVLCGHARLVHARPYLGFSSAPSPGLLFCTGLCGRARLVLARPYLLKRLALITSIPYSVKPR